MHQENLLNSFFFHTLLVLKLFVISYNILINNKLYMS